MLYAFRRLSTCRPIGWAPGPIPWRDIVTFSAMHEMSPAAARLFDRMIEALDYAYLDWLTTERKTAAAAAAAAGGNQGKE